MPRSFALSPLAVALVGCAAPPLGLGMGAHLPTSTTGERTTGMVAHGATALAGSADRRVFQAEGGLGVIGTRWFAFDAGVVYTQLADDSDGHVFAAGGFPYLRPKLTFGNVSLAGAVAGMGFGGGGGGFYGGIADLQLGYGTPSWSVYAGAYGLTYEVVSEGTTRTSGSQERLGGEYLFPVGPMKLGVALELYRQHDELRGNDRSTESRFYGAGVKLRVESGVFR